MELASSGFARHSSDDAAMTPSPTLRLTRIRAGRNRFDDIPAHARRRSDQGWGEGSPPQLAISLCGAVVFGDGAWAPGASGRVTGAVVSEVRRAKRGALVAPTPVQTEATRSAARECSDNHRHRSRCG